jgi:large subunit ribosomal protein L22
MDVMAITRYVRLSPSKAHAVALSVQGKPVADALGALQFSRQKAALLIRKTMKSALANAEKNAKLSADDLWVKRVAVEEGPRLKRYWPRARGGASPILRRLCHLRVVLADET